MSTLHPPKPMDDNYAETVDKLRIYRVEGAAMPTDEDYEGDLPWQVDGYDTSTNRVSEDVRNFQTFDLAVAALPKMAHRFGLVTA